MMLSIASFAPYILIAVGGIIFLAFKLHGEAMKYVAEVKFFLEQKTLAYNQTNSILSVVQSKMKVLQQKNNELEKENMRLRKSLEVMTNELQKRPLQDSPSELLVSTEAIEKLEGELQSIQNVLNRDLKTQLKNYTRELDWLSRRVEEVQGEVSKVTGQDSLSEITDQEYKQAA